MTNNDDLALKEDWRDDYEKIFPIPEGMERTASYGDGISTGYINKSCFITLATVYLHRWAGYKAGREALLAERDADKKQLAAMSQAFMNLKLLADVYLHAYEEAKASVAELQRLREEETMRANRQRHNGFMMATKHMKQHENVHYADAAEVEIAALHERIAELEARTVSVKLPVASLAEINDEIVPAWPSVTIISACEEAGIKLEVGE